MRAGTLRHTVTIQQKSSVQDSFGALINLWTDVASVPAAVQPLRGMERSAAKQTQADADIKVIMRYRTGITTTNRIKFGDRLLDIEAVVNIDERNRTLEILCKAAA